MHHLDECRDWPTPEIQHWPIKLAYGIDIPCSIIKTNLDDAEGIQHTTNNLDSARIKDCPAVKLEHESNSTSFALIRQNQTEILSMLKASLLLHFDVTELTAPSCHSVSHGLISQLRFWATWPSKKRRSLIWTALLLVKDFECHVNKKYAVFFFSLI